ncbi:NAD-dependent epimerase/dehydratase family protein [Actinomadura sp. BRA 177]|uniref:NAD-dependent epimerase/dehydratase family protein n=1 Tax=Actinomadura sp. BRA 177 TaxID=2745202 RepID=UPI0015959B96|nr:NAD-dependent epimerase/dehydratase family protein [Actinomadura sp. BRA 177]NVI88530.1 NAD-dependent epimerase/dehydratase family protein [Actinomadura sp. BRA 177]
MHIFMTGASGYLGGVVAEHLIKAGHEVSALARSAALEARVTALGAKAVGGDLSSADVLREAAASSDTVVHIAVDYADPRMREIEEAALDAFLSAGRPLVYTSTGLVYPDTTGEPVTKGTPIDPESSPQPWKVLGERQALQAEDATVIRAALVYGRGGSGLLEGMFASARQNGVTAYVEDGANEWSSVHVDDLAALYTAAVADPSGRTVVNAATRTRTPMRDIATAVAETAGAQAISLTRAEARELLGPFADVLTRSSPLDPSRAETQYNWRPAGPSLLDDIRTGSYT